MVTIGRLAAVLAGSALALWVLLSAVRAMVVPRSQLVLLTRWFFVAVRAAFRLPEKRAKTVEQRDRALALYAPISMVVLPFTWVTLVIIGFTAIFWGFGVDPLHQAFYLSGSSILTLGLTPPPDLPTHIAVFIEALLGLGLIALLISYLPTIY